jgi:hypothetical protein
LNPTFNISAAGNSDVSTHLFIHAGTQGISFTELDTPNNTFVSVLIYQFAKQLAETEKINLIDNILQSQPLLQKQFVKSDLIWCSNENILVPQEYFDKATRNEMLTLVYGDAVNTVVKDELVLRHNLYNVYRIKTAAEEIIIKKFPQSLQTHHASLLIDMAANEKEVLYCNFLTDSLTVMLRKNGQLQLIQNFEFTTPEDAVYHLLNVCRSFEVDAPAMVLSVSGMIDESSNLYNELHKYFAGINLYALPGNFNYAAEILAQPAHYFSHLFATAACVL